MPPWAARKATGVIRTPEGEFVVEETIKLLGGKYGHVGYMKSGMLKVGDTVSLEVCETARKDTEKNHSATHLLQKALKTGTGFSCGLERFSGYSDRLRFDCPLPGND